MASKFTLDLSLDQS